MFEFYIVCVFVDKINGWKMNCIISLTLGIILLKISMKIVEINFEGISVEW